MYAYRLPVSTSQVTDFTAAKGEKEKGKNSEWNILHQGSCDHYPRHSAEETSCDIRHFPFVQMHSFHQIKIKMQII